MIFLTPSIISRASADATSFGAFEVSEVVQVPVFRPRIHSKMPDHFCLLSPGKNGSSRVRTRWRGVMIDDE